MKRFILIVLAAVFAAVSCSREPETAEYTVIWDFEQGAAELMIWECDDFGSKLTSHIEHDISKGKSVTYTAIPEATKIKIYFETTKNAFNISVKRWVQQVHLLRPGENIQIVINDNTIVGTDEP